MIKVWLITGASSGFGKRLTLSALARGDKVVATARSMEKLRDAFPLLDYPSSTLATVQLDMNAGTEAIHKATKEALSVWGIIDVLVNNAGYGIAAIVEEAGASRLREQYDTNLFGLIDCVTAVLPHMRERKCGTIVNIGSRSAWKSDLIGLGLYGSSKAAVHALGETLAVELAPLNIKVLTVAPGAFRTEGIYNNPQYLEPPIADYEETRIMSKLRMAAIAGTQKGDPSKAAEIIVDVVRNEGCAVGRSWPKILVLGEDSESDLRDYIDKTLASVEEWKDVIRSTNFDE